MPERAEAGPPEALARRCQLRRKFLAWPGGNLGVSAGGLPPPRGGLWESELQPGPGLLGARSRRGCAGVR
ncbi:unnamed protein product [Rangifer tarandus platyrhynchus]|uniref:Uncharacterized protein n=2 Tax=Rangifer tarandus platyrhynchus TaxID=3082113 RepID=A0ABN8Y7M0_RANTA|nr:unnamed protein product [Rangifer tarandus platyrhynchus]CAI9693477.1 unnamed protein product [Rangifer tarandus platyrhynchus]